VKIAVRDEGLYYVSTSELAPLLGGSAEFIGRLAASGRLSLTCGGEAVAYLPAEDGAGLTFYGQAVDSIYTAENVYWLARGRGVLMSGAGESGADPAAEPQAFTETVHVEEDRYAATGLFRDPEADFWLWDYIVSGQGRKSFTVRADGASPVGVASVTVHLKGATSTRSEPDHHARVYLNGVVIGETVWDGHDAQSVTLPVAAGLLLDGANTVSVEGVLDTGAPYSIFYVDSFDVTYSRRYEAVDDRLLCRSGTHPAVTVDGFTQPQVLVLDVTEPRRPRRVVETAVEQMGEDAYRVTFPCLGLDGAYLATTPEAVRRPVWLRADEPSRLKWRGNRADYLVIAASELRDGAQALADYRQGDGLAASVVMVEDIYDEFNHGLASPKAIQSFLAYAGSAWRQGPQFVVLAGNGTYDYKNHLGVGDNLVPPLLLSTGYGLFAADRILAPQVAIGRLPARSAGELDVLVAKIVAYEQSAGPWTKRVLLAADNADDGGDFPRDSDDLAGLVPAGYETRKVYLSGPVPDTGAARQALFEGFAEGALLVNYMGHGGVDRLAQEGLLTVGDVSGLGSGDRLPVVTALTCVSGRFALPGYDCLGEALVLEPSGGAIAFWGPAGLLLNRQSKALGEAFLRAALESGERVLGRAVQAAHRASSGHSTPTAPLDLYNLLGDPALKLRNGE
jgi:hypothetical protein